MIPLITLKTALLIAALLIVLLAVVPISAQEKANELLRLTNPPTLSQPKAYSHIAEVRSGRLVFLSGQVSQDVQGNVVGKGDMRVQTRLVFANLKAALEAVGADWSNIVKMNTYITDAANIPIFREVREEVLAEVKPRPASTAVVVSKLFGDDWLVEIDAVVVIPAKPLSTKKK